MGDPRPPRRGIRRTTSWLARLRRPRTRTSRRKPVGEAGILALGHRRYVGGRWEEMGRLQFGFLRARGLQATTRLVDVGCGSLRAGVHLIPWLEPGHYFGIEKEPGLVRAGLEEELDPAVRDERRPTIVVDAGFDFERLGSVFDMGIAQSLFSHVPPAVIRACLGRLRPFMADGGVLYATFFETGTPVDHDETPHDHGDFHYTRAEMRLFGIETGWFPEYIGDWGHPRGQRMIAYHARERRPA